MSQTRTHWIILSTLVVAACIEGAFAWSLAQPSCPTQRARAAISGGSLEPLVRDGAELTLFQGYYECRDVKRGDLVAFKYGGSTHPLIKIARGVPGDTLALEERGGGIWHILVNGKVATNSVGEPYEVDGRQKILFDFYLKDYRGVIPPDTYLLLGDLRRGSKDSRDFGFVSKKDVIGKAQ